MKPLTKECIELIEKTVRSISPKLESAEYIIAKNCQYMELALTTPEIYRAAGLTEVTQLEGRKSAEDILNKYRTYPDGTIKPLTKIEFLEAMEEYANQSPLTDEELEAEAEGLYPYFDGEEYLNHRVKLGKRAAHIKARKMGSKVSVNNLELHKELTFDDLVQHGKDNGANIVNGMPWSWKINGKSITHENDDCYLIDTIDGVRKFIKGNTLIAFESGLRILIDHGF